VPKGGARPGAGRKRGTANRKTREIADRAAADGVTPLEYMLAILRKETPVDASKGGHFRHEALRFEAAKAAAPYMHPRMSPMDSAVSIAGLSGGLADQARAICAALSARSITPGQASTLMQTIAVQARIFEVDELDKRVAALEQRTSRKNAQ